MACRLSEIVVNSLDPAALARWWADVLGYQVLDSEDGVVEIGLPGQRPTLVFVPVADPTPGPRRLHLDLNATDRDQEAELQRLLALGARPADVGQPPEVSWHVLADPEGNEFCLLRSRVEPA